MAKLSKSQLLQAYPHHADDPRVPRRRCAHRVPPTGCKIRPGFVHLYAGEEASATGVCMHLRNDDYIASTTADTGTASRKGVDPVGMMAEIYGKVTGTCKGKAGPCTSLTSPGE